jgi:hypothetical protein
VRRLDRPPECPFGEAVAGINCFHLDVESDYRTSAGLGLYLLQKQEMLLARDKNQGRLLRVTSALGLNQFVEYLRDHLLLDKCVD